MKINPLFLFLFFSILLFYYCSKDSNEFIPRDYIGDIIIDSEEDFSFLQDFFENGFNSVIGDIVILEVSNIDFDLLENVKQVSGDIEIKNSTLSSLEFFSELISCGGLDISASNIEGFNLKNLKSVENNINIFNTPKLLKEEIFENLTTVGGAIYLDPNRSNYFFAFPKLTKVKHLVIYNANMNDLRTVVPVLSECEVISIVNCDSIKNLHGLENLHSLTQLSLDRNLNIENLSGVNNITDLQIIFLQENENLTSLSGLDNVLHVKLLELIMNNNLSSLNGLESIVEISESMNIQANPILNDYCAISPYALYNLVNTVSYSNTGNGFNPSLQMLKDGICNVQ